MAKKRQKQGNNINQPDRIHGQLKARGRKARKKGRKISVCHGCEFTNWYWEQERKCYYCGIPEELLIPLGWQHGQKKRLTIERKRSDEGYTLDNMVFACERCNLIKNDFLTATEMKQIAHKYLKPKWKKLYEKSNNRIG